MEYAISNFTDIGIKDIQLKYIENIVEKSIYGIYCLALYLIRNIRNSRKNKNNKYSSSGPGRGIADWDDCLPPRLTYNRTFTMVCCGHTACVVGAILYYMYITSNIY